MNGADRRLEFDFEARHDILEAENEYEKHSEQASDRFLELIEDTLEKIRQDPAMGRPADYGAFVYRLKRFPFRIVYVDLERLQMIYVLGVIHESRRSDLWHNRVQRIPADPEDPDEDEG